MAPLLIVIIVGFLFIVFCIHAVDKDVDKKTNKNDLGLRIIRKFEPGNVSPTLSEMVAFLEKNKNDLTFKL